MQKRFLIFAIAAMLCTMSCNSNDTPVTPPEKPDEPDPVEASLSVKPDNRTVTFSYNGLSASSNGGDFSPTFTVEENVGEWDAVSSDDSWLHVSKGNDSFTLSADAVTTASSREATVTVTAGEAEEIIITVTQNGASSELLYGFISDTDGNPIAGVVVSDGFQCVPTDENGMYQMIKNKDAKFVFYSTPAEYEVNTLNSTVNSAMFYSPILSYRQRYDFTLKRLPAVETEFTLLCIADPQVGTNDEMARFLNEFMPDLNEFVDAAEKPCYGLILGDVVCDRMDWLGTMRNHLGSTDMKFFATPGNHDKTSNYSNAAAFTTAFGPLDFSFNRGDVHFIGMDNILYEDENGSLGGFYDYQIEWLKQDLSFVPKDKLIIAFFHIPGWQKNRTAFLNVFRNFSRVQFMSGHTHYHRKGLITTNPSPIHEHIHGAVCGAWWYSTVNHCGAPNGYGIFEVKGNEFVNSYYKAVKYSKDFQIRLHWGDTQFGGTYRNYSYNQPGKIVANIWNADTDWVIEAYEDGVPAGNPTRLGVITDAFAVGYFDGVLGRGATEPMNNHAFVHTLKNPNAKVIEIRATDGFGNTYSQTEIISDLSSAAGYND